MNVKLLFAILLLAMPAQALELREIDLVPLEFHYSSNALDLSKSIYRIGEVVRTEADDEQLWIVLERCFYGHQWHFRLGKINWEAVSDNAGLRRNRFLCSKGSR